MYQLWKNEMESIYKFFSNYDMEKNYKTNENGDSLLKIEVPGFNKDNLNVSIENEILTVEGKTDSRTIFKQYTLTNVSDVKAVIKDGILTLTLIRPKKTINKIEITS